VPFSLPIYAPLTARGEDGVQGSYTGALAAGGRRFAGQWTSADGDATVPFRYTAVAAYRTTTTKTDRLTQTASYPVFLATGAAWRALNAAVAQLVTDTQQRFRANLPTAPPPEGTAYYQDVNIEAAYADPQLVSLLLTEDFYTGGAHPGLTYRSANYAMTGARPRLLSLSDLFDPHAGYQAMLLELTVADMNAQKSDRGGLPPVPKTFALDDITVYTITAYTLTFHFAPDLAGAYAEGPYAVLFPYGSLDEYLNPHGPLERFAEGS